MAITEKDEERIEYAFVMAFLPELPMNDETADKALKAWNQLWDLMERENNFSNQLGSSVLDWQIWSMDSHTVSSSKVVSIFVKPSSVVYIIIFEWFMYAVLLCWCIVLFCSALIHIVLIITLW